MICDNCMNNPKNNPYASGFCNCALPAMEIGDGWFIADRTQTTRRFTTSNFTVNYTPTEQGNITTERLDTPTMQLIDQVLQYNHNCPFN